MNLPMKIFFTVNGLSPFGESNPPSIENPKPPPSFINSIILWPCCVGIEGPTTKNNFLKF